MDCGKGVYPASWRRACRTRVCRFRSAAAWSPCRRSTGRRPGAGRAGRAPGGTAACTCGRRHPPPCHICAALAKVVSPTAALTLEGVSAVQRCAALGPLRGLRAPQSSLCVLLMMVHISAAVQAAATERYGGGACRVRCSRLRPRLERRSAPDRRQRPDTLRPLEGNPNASKRAPSARMAAGFTSDCRSSQCVWMCFPATTHQPGDVLSPCLTPHTGVPLRGPALVLALSERSEASTVSDAVSTDAAA